MKRILAALLALMLLLALAGCAKGNEAEIALLQAQLNQMQEQMGAQSGQSASSTLEEEDDVPPSEYVYLFNAQADGSDKVEFKEQITVDAQAVIPEGMALEAWARDGVVLEGYEPEETLTLNADTTTVVEARLRPEKTVTTINAQMKFLNEKDEPKGEPFEKFVFEKDFVNPVTGELHKGGTITVYVEAVVPKGYVIDYWKINEIPYYYNKTVSAFVVEELDESTVYEVVLREAKATPTPKPTKTPNATPVPTQEQEIVDPEEDWKDTPAPEATPAPVMYNVSCTRCSYGGGKTSGQVPAGTTITVTGRGDLSGRFYVNGSAAGEYVKSITLTIDRDTDIEFNEIIN